MPTIHTIGAVQIKIYFNEHGAPHFHVVAAGRDAKILIDAEATVLDSGLTRRQLRDVRDWAVANQDLLMKHWNETTLGT